MTAAKVSQRRVEHCMGTVFSFDIREPAVTPAAVDAAVRWLHWVDDTFSTYKPESQISRLGRGELTVAECAPAVGQILQRCAQLADETAGHFSLYSRGFLDPSGLVKGWAVQRVSEMLRAAGSLNHCVNGGGDVQCAGTPAPGQLWRIGIAHPLLPGTLAGVAEGGDPHGDDPQGGGFAVATSGTAERGDHIHSPDGQPATGLASVTLIGAKLATTDAYATAAFAMAAAAPDWIAAQAGYQGLVIFADGSRWSSPGLAQPSVQADICSTRTLGHPAIGG